MILHTEQLLELADQAGFSAFAQSPSYSACADIFSVCVAAPPYDAGERYHPFNLKQDGSSSLLESNLSPLRAAAAALSPDGLMFIYGLPAHLARYAVALSDVLVFRYWIAVRTMTAQKETGLRPEHTGLLVLSKPGATLNRVRVPHARCRYCGEALKDWGGKSHLMHPDGAALSDVWMDLVVDPQDRMPPEIFARILQLCPNSNGGPLLLLAADAPPRPPQSYHYEQPALFAFNPLRHKAAETGARRIPDHLINRLHRAPCLEVLRAIPSGTVDLAFADPPFNLTKAYNGYADDRDEGDYIGWCKRWLVEYERVLKPGGALIALNLPRWSAWLADFLCRTAGLYLQNWVVWNALPEPKGVLMPAHYALLYFTKGKTPARFNYCPMEKGWQPFDEAVFPPDRPDVCQRRSCVRKRRASSDTWRGELTDIWHDIHRERRASQRANKAHPCQTPERLLDRIIRLTTHAGDLVLDAFAGTGTSALVAQRLGRRFIAIEQDYAYLRVAEKRLSESAAIRQRPPRMPRRNAVSQRSLQLELKELALTLGRLPTRADVERLSDYPLAAFDAAFTSWNVALKAAKAVISSSAYRNGAREAHAQMDFGGLNETYATD